MYRIDAHQYYWNPARGDYRALIRDEALERPFLPADLRPEMAEHGVSKTVLIQAAPTLEETEYLLGIADATPSVAAVVGWVNFEDAARMGALERLAAHPKFIGVRPMIAHQQDPAWMLREDVQWAFEALVDLDLTLDAMVGPEHLDNLRTILGHYPDLRCVIDHCARPAIADFDNDPKAFRDWSMAMTRLAEETSAHVKLSGLIDLAGPDWEVADLRPVAEHVLTRFGAGRVMWGSDWPFVRRNGGYDAWMEAALDLTGALSPGERDAVFATTAKRFYGLRD